MGVFDSLETLVQSEPRSKPVTLQVEGQKLKKFLYFCSGVLMGLILYFCLLKKIPFPSYVKLILVVIICFLMGLANATSIQMRCVSALTVPTCLGKAGRGVLKAVIFTYVIAGPIANLGVNAREVVRVFACSSSLSHNMSKLRYQLMYQPVRNALYGMKDHLGEVKDTWRSFREVAAPIEREIEGDDEIEKLRRENDHIDKLMGNSARTNIIDEKYKIKSEDKEWEIYEKKYLKKMEYRCFNQLSRGTAICMEAFAGAYEKCMEEMPALAAHALCWPARLRFVCNLLLAVGGRRVCDSRKQIDPGLGEGYMYLKKSAEELGKDLKDVRVQYRVSNFRDQLDVQDARETGKRVMQSFDEKDAMLQTIITIVNVLFALIFIRIFISAQKYHDRYITKIQHDNIYITKYFRTLDERRRAKKKYTLLPLKKIEKTKYMEVNAIKYSERERDKMVVQMLKLSLEVMTATTFIMLERMFYEALDVVRKHAAVEYTQQGLHDLTVEVEGTGMLASLIRSVLSGLNTKSHVHRVISNEACLPNPHLMSNTYFVKIYGGYLWVLTLIYFDAYTVRLRRLVCSYFYPSREKQRILHLYNDLLKKRIKMKKTLRKSTLRVIRSRRLTADDMLSWRLRFPRLLAWLAMFPAARHKCLICGETQPRSLKGLPLDEWVCCPAEECRSVYCGECWRDIGCRCLACDPTLHDVSETDSLSDCESPHAD